MGAYLSSPNTEKKTVTGSLNSFRYFLLSFAATEMQGWRLDMEDAKIHNLEFEASAQLFGVFDGHGGKEVAIFVERHFGRELLNNPNYQSNNLEIALQETFLRMDQMILTVEGQRELIKIKRDLPENFKVSEENADSMAGCTSVVALVKNNKVYVANAGDSRCVMARNRVAIEMSHDHKPNNPEEYNRIVKAGGSVEDGRVMGNLNLSRAIGDMEYKRNNGLPPQDQIVTAFPDVIVEEITQDTDFLILACDGIWDMLTCQQAVDLVYEGINSNMSLKANVERVLDRCLAPDIGTYGGLGCDNMTCMIVRLK